MSLNRRQQLDYTQKYQIQSGRVNFVNYVQRRQLVQDGRLLGLNLYPPDNDASIVPLIEDGAVNTTPEELARYLAEVEQPDIPTTTRPNPPTNLLGTSGDGEVTISFTPPVNTGGSPITGYTITSSPGGFTATGSSSPIIVTGLTNGTAYTFTAIATNSIGNSDPSAPSSSVTPATIPGAPTSVSAVAGNAQATISFTAPVSDGGSPITEYTITSSPGGFTATGSSSPIIVTGLTNGTAYTFTAIATNSVGDSVASSPSSSVTPATIPGAPTSVSAVAGNAQATISFTAPASNGGSPITGYTITSSPGGFTATGSSSPIVVTGLTNGTAYTFTAVATNSIGNSVASSPSSAVTPVTIPGAPTSVSAVAGNAQATISFTAPASNGGSPITGYTITSSPGGFTATGSSSPIVVTGLSNGTAYTFTAVATNSVGNSVASSPSSAVTPATTPSPPTALVGSPGSQQASISFTPGSNGGSAITNYQYSTDGGSTFIALSPADATSPVTITTLSSDGTTPLTNNTTYSIQLKAVNAIGVSSASASVSVTPVPSIQVIILGDSAVTTLSTSIQSARTALGYSVPLSITTQQLNGYTGTNLSSFQVAIFYTNGGLNLNATLGANLNTFVSNGGHLIMASFSWGNVTALSGFTFNSYSTFEYKGTFSSVNASTAVYTITHPITTGIATSTGLGSPNIPNPITLTTIPNSQVIATYSGGTSFIAVGQNGSARLVGINAYVAGAYSGLFQNTIKYVCNSIYWCVGLI